MFWNELYPSSVLFLLRLAVLLLDQIEGDEGHLPLHTVVCLLQTRAGPRSWFHIGEPLILLWALFCGDIVVRIVHTETADRVEFRRKKECSLPVKGHIVWHCCIGRGQHQIRIGTSVESKCRRRTSTDLSRKQSGLFPAAYRHKNLRQYRYELHVARNGLRGEPSTLSCRSS